MAVSAKERVEYWGDTPKERHCGNQKKHDAHVWANCSWACVCMGHVDCHRSCPGTQPLPKAKVR